jgi:hypothetical protein
MPFPILDFAYVGFIAEMSLLTDLDRVTGDVLGKMIIARDEETAQTMTDSELRDQTMTLMLAGHEVCIPIVNCSGDVYFRDT